MNTREFDKYEQQRELLQKEINEEVFEPLSFEIYAKTEAEKIELKNAKERFKANK